MIAVRGRNIINKKPVDPNSEIVIKVTLSNMVNPSTSFATLKYNKKSGFICVKDDGGIEDYTVGYAYFKGGIPAKDGITYPGIYYSDGTAKLIPYRMTYAINTNNPKTDDNAFGLTPWSKYILMANDGFGVANHSRDHGGYDIGYQIKDAEKTIFDNTGMRTTTFVVPTNDAGYANAAPYLGYDMIGSEGAFDDYTDATPSYYNPTAAYKYGVYYGGRIDAKIFDRHKLLFNRYYAGEGKVNDLDAIKTMVNEVFVASKNRASAQVGHWFHHGLTDAEDPSKFEYWKALIQYIVNHPDNNDSVWMPTMQEFTEYFQVKELTTKTELIEENQLTVTLSFDGVPNTNSLRDMSLLLTGGTISNIEVIGADSFTFNSTAGLINIYKKNLTIKNPSTDIMPARILSATRNGNSILLTYEKPVVQTIFSNGAGNAYSVSNNTVTGVTGSGTNWVINCQNMVGAGATFSYRMQRGDALDGNGLRILTYINYPTS